MVQFGAIKLYELPRDKLCARIAQETRADYQPVETTEYKPLTAFYKLPYFNKQRWQIPDDSIWLVKPVPFKSAAAYFQLGAWAKKNWAMIERMDIRGIGTYHHRKYALVDVFLSPEALGVQADWESARSAMTAEKLMPSWMRLIDTIRTFYQVSFETVHQALKQSAQSNNPLSPKIGMADIYYAH